MRIKTAWLLVLPLLLFARPTTVGLLVGAAIATVGLIGRGWSAGVIRKDETLTTGGPYAFTRNPLYLGSLCIGLGLAVAGGHWIWLVLCVGYFAGIYAGVMSEEEERLRGLFGDRYADYVTSVPRLLPRLTPYRSQVAESGSTFSWSRYRRNREWEALLGAAAAFAMLGLKVV